MYLQRTAWTRLRERCAKALLFASVGITNGCTASTYASSQVDPMPPCTAPTRYEVALPAPADTLVHAIYLQCTVAPDIGGNTARTQVRLVNVSGRTLRDIGWASRGYMRGGTGRYISNPMGTGGRIRDWAPGEFRIIQDGTLHEFVAPYDPATGGGRDGADYGREIVPLQLVPASSTAGIGNPYAGFWLPLWSESSAESQILQDTVVIPQRGDGTDGHGTWISVNAIAGIGITWPYTAISCGGPAVFVPSSFIVRGDTLRSTGDLVAQRFVGGMCNPRALLGTGTMTLVRIP